MNHLNFRAFFGKRDDLDLPGFENDRLGVVVWYEIKRPHLIDKVFNAPCEIVGVEQTDTASSNADANARPACALSFVRWWK